MAMNAPIPPVSVAELLYPSLKEFENIANNEPAKIAIITIKPHITKPTMARNFAHLAASERCDLDD